MPENNNIMSLEGQLCGIPLAGPESFSQQQLDYLKRALGVDETVLWEGSLTDANCMQAFDLNDNPFNFEYLRFYWTVDNCNMVTEGRVITGNADVCSDFGWYYSNWKTIKNQLRFTAPVGSTPAKAQFIDGISYMQTTSSASLSDFRHNWSYCFRPLVKIVGIHRISGGN